MRALQVLVVEDDPLIARLLAEVLRDMGHAICAIEATEAGAVAAADRYRPDLMIVDVRLARGSGVSAIEEILRGGFVAHVFISGSRLNDRELSPHTIVLQKPFIDSDLARAVRHVVGAAALPE